MEELPVLVDNETNADKQVVAVNGNSEEPEKQVVPMSYEDALRERVREFVWNIIQSTMPTVSVQETSLLVDDFALQELDRLEIARLFGLPDTALDFTRERTFGKLCDVIQAEIERKSPNRFVFCHRLWILLIMLCSPAGFFVKQNVVPKVVGVAPNVWTAEVSQQFVVVSFQKLSSLSNSSQEILDPLDMERDMIAKKTVCSRWFRSNLVFLLYFVAVEQFALLRRQWRTEETAFGNHWRQLSLHDMRVSVFRIAPVTLDDTDEIMETSRKLLPAINVSNLMGEHLLLFFRTHFNTKYKDLLAADLAHARTIAKDFQCPAALQGKWFDVEKRRLVEHREGMEHTARLVEGAVWGVYCALAGSRNALLGGLLGNFVTTRDKAANAAAKRAAAAAKAKQEAFSNAPKQCDVCGKVAVSVCSRCKRRRFCGRACQTSDWPTHKMGCSAPTFALKLPEYADEWIENVDCAIVNAMNFLMQQTFTVGLLLDIMQFLNVPVSIVLTFDDYSRSFVCDQRVVIPVS
jgi:hypothetical protein